LLHESDETPAPPPAHFVCNSDTLSPDLPPGEVPTVPSIQPLSAPEDASFFGQFAQCVLVGSLCIGFAFFFLSSTALSQEWASFAGADVWVGIFYFAASIVLLLFAFGSLTLLAWRLGGTQAVIVALPYFVAAVAANWLTVIVRSVFR